MVQRQRVSHDILQFFYSYFNKYLLQFKQCSKTCESMFCEGSCVSFSIHNLISSSLGSCGHILFFSFFLLFFLKFCIFEILAPPFLRYGKYCGLLYTGCPGEQPCDRLDTCCMHHDQCISNMGSKFFSFVNYCLILLCKFLGILCLIFDHGFDGDL